MRSTPSISLATTGPKRWLTSASGICLRAPAVDDRGDQRILVELEVGENLGDLQAGAESSTCLPPRNLGRIGLLFGLTSELAGFFQGFAIQCRSTLTA
jgi:hypothetical protein